MENTNFQVSQNEWKCTCYCHKKVFMTGNEGSVQSFYFTAKPHTIVWWQLVTNICHSLTRINQSDHQP